ncbi:ER membrane protein complex subunit 6-like isoform X2 [Haliotis rufescens]|uniref:ER membrane protein complex subunit 6-like isoform X2 n=1 Tax=Haliotis rufescens TaxID=6454 RepID=UPI00201F11C9|nr:ER membrane protein complex subunit 6-like isoform X2 [Haliotis rufescens]
MATTIAVRTRKSRRDVVAYSELAVRGNASIIEYCRTSLSALSGATAGILGLTALYGFAFYFITAFLLSMMLLIKAGSRWNSFFVSRRIPFFNGVFGGLFTYVLFWTYPFHFIMFPVNAR